MQRIVDEQEGEGWVVLVLQPEPHLGLLALLVNKLCRSVDYGMQPRSARLCALRKRIIGVDAPRVSQVEPRRAVQTALQEALR